MKRSLHILGANAMAAFMDFGIGTLVAAVVAFSFDIALSWQYLLLGGLLALLPDVDIIPSIITGRSAQFDHRQTIFHRPLLIITAATTISWCIGGEMWAIITFFAVIWHFVHDTNFIDMTYGIAWLWPFSDMYWYFYGPFTPNPGMEHHTWLERYWLKPTFLSVREILIGAVALLAAGSLMHLSLLPVAVICGAVSISVAVIWYSNHN